ERTAQALIAARRHALCDRVARRTRRTTARAEVDFVEVALVVPEIGAQRERLEMPRVAQRPLRRRAPIVAGNLRGETRVLIGTERGRTERGGALILDL